MPISDSDYKILWGRAAGICSSPSCRKDLTVILTGVDSYNIGEMAHIIARSPTGPRATGASGSDSYENLILLCPTCHTAVDKAPAQYPEPLLRRWKNDHEKDIRNRGLGRKFDHIATLKNEVRRLLAENHAVWRTLGPKSDAAISDPGSNLYVIWNRRKLDTIVPNNRQIINLVEGNASLLSASDYAPFLDFKLHAEAYEAHQLDRLDSYPLFPASFAEAFGQ